MTYHDMTFQGVACYYMTEGNDITTNKSVWQLAVETRQDVGLVSTSEQTYKSRYTRGYSVY